ncbi:FKBP-type peptidyl-prolyl cis-trans isomerase [Pseudolysinimonas sp.]|uniref:FKBP-type peptidyl-prolyl cis-trans isomerase n=1 Tax=Pseudolysinimonas sp. TaxID=2680009 RepID=UPI00286A7C3C|nr:FKBP-type peptidyl-prolyl cis-trans isomerase [Pseudolysinimonas sp.]
MTAVEGILLRRSLLALPFVLASALVLAGCSADDGTTPDATETDTSTVGVCETPDGAAVSAVDVSGDFGSAPTIAFDAGLEVATTERVVVIEGDEVEPGQLVSAAYALYNGTTGEELETYGWAEGDPATPFRADYDMLFTGFAKTLGCLGPGSRAVGVIPNAEGFGEQAETVGIGVDDVLVFVVDVLSDNVWSTDVPEVGGTAEAPTVTLPAIAPKTDLEIAVLEEGAGDVVGLNDSVSVHYLGTAWETGVVFDSSFDRGAPATFAVSGVVQGFQEALVGQTVGSKILVTMPPALGYGASEGHELQNSTLVFYIEIVELNPAA